MKSAASKKPEGKFHSRHSNYKKRMGQPTRGKTASNRLRRVDNFILLYEPLLLTRTNGLFADSLFVDLGYGFDPRTTLESAIRFRRVNPKLKILGVEIEKERVDAAQHFANATTFFRLGGFNLPLEAGEHVRLIRAFNVLRQYEEADFIPAMDRMMEYVLPGGLIIEGTSNPFGSIWAANIVRKKLEFRSLLLENRQQAVGIQNTWKMEALVFSTNFRLGFEAEEFQTILPKNYIHRMIEGESIHEFFEAWKRSIAETSATKVYGMKQWFISSAEALSQKGFDVDIHRKWLSRGYLIWHR